jgi:osmotically-inducible protein OsmY
MEEANEGEPMRQGKQSRISIVTLLGTFVLSTALVSGTASAQQQRQQQQRQQQQRQQQQRQQQQGQMTKFHDSRIEDRIEMRLARSASLSGTDIMVNVEDRVATLSGTVGSQQEQERAMQLARRVRGVQDVKANLNIDKEAMEQRRNVEVEDQELAKQIAMKLANDTFPGAEAEEEWFAGWEVEGYSWEFDVEVDNGRVTLEGDVDPYSDITEAIKAARAVPGVRSVESELTTADLYDSPYYRGLNEGYSYYYGHPYYRGYPYSPYFRGNPSYPYP